MSMNNNTKNKQGGFIIKLIIFVVAAFFVMKYFNISVSDVIDWVKALFSSVSQ